MLLTRRDALSLLLAAVPAALLAGCGGGGGDSESDNSRNVYMALGDSYAYGYTTQGGTPNGLGDIGYVKLFADALASVNGDVRPALLNLAIPGETTVSYLRSGNGTPALPYNQNYAATNSPSQSTLLNQKIVALRANNERIRWVTLQIGGNDLLHLFVDPAFRSASSTEQQAILSTTLNTVRTNIQTILSQIRTLVPQATLFVIGYADPFVGLGAANPLAGLSTPLTRQVNTIISQETANVSGRFVDVFTPFQGQETTLTLITTEDPPGSGIPDFHPSAAGYTRIAELLVTANSQ
jgi:lysophospholipase L1-like esterase